MSVTIECGLCGKPLDVKMADGVMDVPPHQCGPLLPIPRQIMAQSSLELAKRIDDDAVEKLYSLLVKCQS